MQVNQFLINLSKVYLGERKNINYKMAIFIFQILCSWYQNLKDWFREKSFMNPKLKNTNIEDTH